MPSVPLPAGLTLDEAARRLARGGPNALPQPHRRSLLRLVVDVLREPMLAGGLICLALEAVLGMVAVMLALMMGLPAARYLFGIALPPNPWMTAPLAAGLTVLLLHEGMNHS